MADIDLHTHSTASDGTLQPRQLVAAAKEAGLTAVALTDHDTTSGLQEAVAAGTELGIEVIPGCELSVVSEHGHMHIVGLWVPVQAEKVQEKLSYLRQRRHSRNERILAKLQDQGLDLSYDEVKGLAGGSSIGRPHIAQLLMNKAYVASITEAFDRFIGPGGSAYVPKDKLTPEAAIDVLNREGATVVLAHPYSLELQIDQLRSEVLRLQELGLHGLEVFYPDHSPEQTGQYLDLCTQLGLLISGGSDFHGSVKPDIALGRGREGLGLTREHLEAMKRTRQERGVWIT